MQIIRRLETAAGNLFKLKKNRGFCHLYSGQEACAVGIRASMRPEDAVISGYRVHGWAYLMGVTPSGILAELTGRSDGCSRGKGGSMHMYAKNFYGGNGIVGAQVPIGVGVALAGKYLNINSVCFTLYGDGAANQGQVYEAFNMAKLLNVPAIFVCENNGLELDTSLTRSSANATYYTQGDTIPGIRADGMDVLTVQEVSRFAIDFCLRGNGPIILELTTYRYGGHYISDPGTSYRTRVEVQAIRQTRDPIMSFKEKILSSKIASDDELKVIDSEAKKEIETASANAKIDVEIDLNELTTDIYANFTKERIRGITPWQTYRHKSSGRIYLKEP
ncbi:hypothetical protein AAG570_006711 [Ranatra chinensis]|uniref:pyruvate dehydrogenase (acetyl-transferring) n=1 Tax=Ranatra chinensis TaxID=642074 RepID=A0ABD0ZG38_9HEMI